MYISRKWNPWNKDKKCPEMSEKMKGNKNGLGHPCSEEKKKRIGDAQIGPLNHMYGICGKNHPAWKEEKVDRKYSEDWTERLRDTVREKDRHICKLCGIHQDEEDTLLDVHHIDYDKYNCNLNNLVTLCRSCHIRTNNRSYWQQILTIT